MKIDKILHFSSAINLIPLALAKKFKKKIWGEGGQFLLAPFPKN